MCRPSPLAALLPITVVPVTVGTNDNYTARGVVLMLSSLGISVQFIVNCQSNKIYTVQLANSDFVTLSEPGIDMFIDNFTSEPMPTRDELALSGVIQSGQRSGLPVTI